MAIEKMSPNPLTYNVLKCSQIIMIFNYQLIYKYHTLLLFYLYILISLYCVYKLIFCSINSSFLEINSLYVYIANSINALHNMHKNKSSHLNHRLIQVQTYFRMNNFLFYENKSKIKAHF